MKIFSFLFSFVLFTIYLLRCRIEKQHGNKPAGESKQEAAVQEAPIVENNFFDDRILTLQEMRKAAREEETALENKLKHFNTLNQNGIVVNEKNINRVQSNLYNARRKRLAIENQIYITEKRREKES